MNCAAAENMRGAAVDVGSDILPKFSPFQLISKSHPLAKLQKISDYAPGA